MILNLDKQIVSALYISASTIPGLSTDYFFPDDGDVDVSNADSALILASNRVECFVSRQKPARSKATLADAVMFDPNAPLE